VTEAEAAAAAALLAEGGPPGERPWTAAEIRALATPDALLLGVAAGGEAEILTLAVRPSARRRGLARRLLAAFRAAAATAGAGRAFLEVAEDNAAARALYVADGWIEAGRRPRYYARSDGRPADALILSREL
jgi:ribosomal-protein-alanine N-acetyltransferase